MKKLLKHGRLVYFAMTALAVATAVSGDMYHTLFNIFLAISVMAMVETTLCIMDYIPVLSLLGATGVGLALFAFANDLFTRIVVALILVLTYLVVFAFRFGLVGEFER